MGDYATQRAEPWSKAEIAFAQGILDNGGFCSDVAFRVSRKFRTDRTSNAIRGAINRGILKERNGKSIVAANPLLADNVVLMRRNGFSYQSIARSAGVRIGQVKDICEPIFGLPEPREKKIKNDKIDDGLAALLADDPMADIGVPLVDLRADQCCWPVARWPQDFPMQRFCAQRRLMNGRYFASSYCPEHDLKSRRKPRVICEAAE